METMKYFVEALKNIPLPELIHLKMGMGLYYEVLKRTDGQETSEVRMISLAIDAEVSRRINLLDIWGKNRNGDE